MVSIDASIFLGMHCKDDLVRIYCKNLVVNFLFKGIVISCEEIGKCDNAIWNTAVSTQFEYFVFMDTLMTEGNFHRHTYNSELIERAFINKKSLALELADALSVKHFTLNISIKSKFKNSEELSFSSEKLNHLYKNSLLTKFEMFQLTQL